MRTCSVVGCDGKNRRGIKTFQFPSTYNQTETFKKLSKQRQLAWLSALGLYDDANSSKKICVCDAHFISGNVVCTHSESKHNERTICLQEKVRHSWTQKIWTGFRLWIWSNQRTGLFKFVWLFVCATTEKLQFFRNADILRCSIDGCTVSNQERKCSFYRIPKINERGELKQISESRLTVWMHALGIRNDGHDTHEDVYVCQSHYVAGIKNDQSINVEHFHYTKIFQQK